MKNWTFAEDIFYRVEVTSQSARVFRTTRPPFTMGKHGGRLSIGDRRLIAIHVQYGKKKFAWLLRQGFTKHQISRWKDVPFTAPDESFQDKPRGAPPVALSGKDERKLMRFLEKDEIGIVRKAAEKFASARQQCGESETSLEEQFRLFLSTRKFFSFPKVAFFTVCSSTRGRHVYAFWVFLC